MARDRDCAQTRQTALTNVNIRTHAWHTLLYLGLLRALSAAMYPPRLLCTAGVKQNAENCSTSSSRDASSRSASGPRCSILEAWRAASGTARNSATLAAARCIT
eukprot:scaffold65675_cov85-Phaeocystis_antarctica.AAC.8